MSGDTLVNMAATNRPRVGVDHLTVVPTNFESKEEATDGPADDEDEDGTHD